MRRLWHLMPDRGWQRAFDDPISLPDGGDEHEASESRGDD